ncbi:FitA-like ribbon-helix-helix domain-containing protein [Rhizorhapis sp. SPR117]|uniref:FitA-like ribbon-helix-helix domain-containing protein n=1 Tax=Rhizorhapis sp. SPR117 TaxID=2912611 RepID=UPI001F414E8D|nr:plasmid stabilization protein [Rhizorhapis sp. SPR117]
MASMTIRNIDEAIKSRLRVRAAQHGRSMEDEARDILRAALSTNPGRATHLVDRIRARVARVGGIDLPDVTRDPMRDPVDLS